MKVIETRGLARKFLMGSTEVHALRGVDLSVEQGEFVAIMGPSGSGKSTLLNLLGCLDRPTGGEYLLAGRPVQDLSDRDLAQMRQNQIGFIFQSFNLLPQLSAAENVELPTLYRDQPASRSVAEVLTSVGLADRMDHRPHQLSGGQQQRVAIARALINEPVLLLADEPTGALDSKTGEEMMALLADLHKKGNTILIVTHEEVIAEKCERVVKLRDGEIVSDERLARA
ncbi:MAG: ABC transporter ATP-binding protein [Armatimonadetes bacterium]|nr:ABC transporter ATP-binding protein [Armatimonadota bacterium]